MLSCEKIIIVGFSGVGKTTFLRQIASCPPSGWSLFSDLDELIFKDLAQKNEKSLSEVIQRVGWERFRLKERQIWESWLKEEEKGVLAFGGGALTPVVWEMLKGSTKVKFCYLKSDFETCFKRLQNDLHQPRPLLEMGKTEFEKVFHERARLFEKIPWQIDNTSEGLLDKKAQLFWSGY